MANVNTAHPERKNPPSNRKAQRQNKTVIHYSYRKSLLISEMQPCRKRVEKYRTGIKAEKPCPTIRRSPCAPISFSMHWVGVWGSCLVSQCFNHGFMCSYHITYVFVDQSPRGLRQAIEEEMLLASRFHRCRSKEGHSRCLRASRLYLGPGDGGSAIAVHRFGRDLQIEWIAARADSCHRLSGRTESQFGRRGAVAEPSEAAPRAATPWENDGAA